MGRPMEGDPTWLIPRVDALPTRQRDTHLRSHDSDGVCESLYEQRAPWKISRSMSTRSSRRGHAPTVRSAWYEGGQRRSAGQRLKSRWCQRQESGESKRRPSPEPQTLSVTVLKWCWPAAAEVSSPCRALPRETSDLFV